jgi:hypothetical protein
MTLSHRHMGAALALTIVASGPIASRAQVNETLTDKDRAEIQSLLAAYSPALLGCKAEAYADLFATPGGYFASGPRGEVRERRALAEMVMSYDRCFASPAPTGPAGGSGAAAGAPRGNAPRPAPVIEPAPEGAKARFRYGNGAGYYDDVYVRTPKGWKFKSRTVISDEEVAAHLSAQDFVEIRQLAGDDHGHYEDMYGDHEHPTPGGSANPRQRPFRTSGLRLLVSPEGVRGLAYLRDDLGHYEDLYVKTPAGWRIKERKYFPPLEAK